MMYWVKIVAVISCIGAGFAAASGKMPADKLEFEHIGPEDASIPSFIVAVGQPNDATHAVIFVTQKAYDDIFVLIKRASQAPVRSPRPMGTFHVISCKTGETDKEFTIYPEDMLSVIGLLRQMFESRHRKMPEVLVKLEALLSLPR
jgi:hypothetical protein